MARDFKIELDNVEMINGSDDLLKDTKVTKVTLTGENKLNSLNSTFENCTELTAIEGDVNLDGVSDMTEMTLNTPLDEIKVTNPTEENIQTDNSLNQVTNVKIGGTKYSKGGVQDVVGSLEWNAENFTYEDTILDNVYTNSSSIEDNKNITVSDTLEQKATSIEITGQTYENLVNGKATENLLDKMSMQQTEGKPTQFTPHMEQPICLEYIEGETYQNLIEGKGEYKLTDTFSATWTESNNSIENPPSMIEIPEIFGNTVQGFANCVTTDQIVTSLVNTINTGATDYGNVYLPNNKGGYLEVGKSNLRINDFSLLTDDCFIQLKPNTTYSYDAIRLNSTQKPSLDMYFKTEKLGTIYTGANFTTDSTGKVIIYPNGVQGGQIGIKLVEGKYDLTQYPWDYDLNYIQSVGDLYVDESGEPILDEEGNEQYKLELISNDGNSNSNKTTILMPQPLRKIKTVDKGYVYDKLYWDNSNNKYFIEKVVGKQVVNVNNLAYADGEHVFNKSSEKTNLFKLNIAVSNIPSDFIKTDYTNNIRSYCICDKAKGYDDYEIHWNKDEVCCAYGYNTRNTSGTCSLVIWRLPKEYDNVEKSIDYLKSLGDITFYVMVVPETIETKILEKPSLETYSPKTYISTNTEIQPSQMTITNKKVDFIPLGLQANKDYTLQLDSIGKNDKLITVNLGGTETTIQPINDASKHHKVVVRTPSTLSTDKLDLSGEGVVVNDVMLFEGGSNEIKQEVGYVEGIESIGKYTITKNKFPNNIVFTKDRTLLNDGTIYGGTTTDYATEDYILCNLDVNKVYSISSPFTYKKVAFYDESKKFISIINTNTNTYLNGFSIPSNAKYYRVSVNNSAGKEIKIQIEEGNTHTSYEEYFEGERYKIDILSTNGIKNLVNTNPNNWVVKDSDTVIIKSSIKVNKGKTYTVFSSMGQWVAVYESDWNGNQCNLIGQDNGGNWSFVATSEYIKVSLWNVSYVSDKLSQPHNMNVRIFEGYNDYGYNGYEERKLSTQSILLPQPLNKKGDIKDKFYWDDNKGHYCIEEKTIEIVLNGSEYWSIQSTLCTDVCFLAYLKIFDSSLNTRLDYINNKFPKLGFNYSEKKDVEGFYTSWGGLYLNIFNDRLPSISIEGFKQWLSENPIVVLCALQEPNIIDLPHLNKKYSLDTYMPTTYVECTNSPMQPSRLLLESDTVRYKSTIEPNTLYTIQFNCLKETIAISTLNLGGTIIEVVPTIGLNHFTITTSNTLTSNELSIIDSDSRFIDVIVNEGEMNQYPGYFNGVQSTGELQDDGTYRIGIKTNEGFNISIQTNNPLAKGDKLYWNKSNKRYEIDRSGSIEVPTVTGDIIDLPRLYQREDTTISISTDNIEPSKIDISYKDIH